MTTAQQTYSEMTTDELCAAYDAACTFSAQLYERKMDDTLAESVCDEIAAELMERGIL